MISGIRVRPATLADADVLSALASRTFPLGCPADTKPADLDAFISRELTSTRFREHIANANVTILLSEVDSRLAGYLMLVRNSRHDLVADATIEVRKLYVDPDYHGRGIADALMRRAESEFVDGTSVWLSVFSGNQRALAFYKKWQFEIIGTHNFLVGSDPQKDCVMRRKSQEDNE
jgi:ribosomal protein S18 acetylase RimI-like enzyme